MRTRENILDQYERIKGVFGFHPMEVSQGSQEWLYMKMGVISASNSHKVCSSGTTRRTYLKHLLAQIFTSEMPEIKAKPMEWGKMHEGSARARYEFEIQKQIVEYPIIFKDDTLRIGASPDGIIHDDSSGNEIKCPYTTEVHLDLLLDEKIKSEYEFQVQHSMYVTGADSWHFSSFDPRMRVKPFIVKIIPRNEVFIKLFDDAYYDFIYMMDKYLRMNGIEFGFQWNLEEYKKLNNNIKHETEIITDSVVTF